MLSRSYKRAERDNATYNQALLQKNYFGAQLQFLEGLQESIRTFNLDVTSKESEWRKAVLELIESEIATDLAFVYPADGYQVNLDSRVLRGKIHIEATVTSTFAKDIPGKIRGTQGRLFQQVVSFSSLIAVMLLLGAKTIYMDEAFSGSAKKNVKKLNKLLLSLKERGFNLVLIAQDISMAEGLPANRMFLSRTVDNKTIIQEETSDYGDE